MTPRQFEVIRLLALGRTYHQVAAELGMARSTVQKHRSAVGRYTGATCVMEILRDLGWLTVPDQMSASASGPSDAVVGRQSSATRGSAAMTRRAQRTAA